MRFAAFDGSDGPPVLHAVVGAAAVPVAALARRHGRSGFPDLADVADLFDLGETVVDDVRRWSAAVEPDDPEAVGLPDRLAPPVGRRTKLICVGLNYRAHAAESGMALPERPVLFAKYPNAVTGHNQPVIRHAVTSQLDYEVELGVVVGRRAHRLARSTAMSAVAGYTIVNDVSGRDLQFGDVQWLRGKSLDTWAPIGPIVVTADEVPDPHALALTADVDGERRQDSTTADMVFDIPDLLAFISEAITLEPGDVIATGTPQGVGMGFKPPRWLEPGSVVEVAVEGIGMLRSPIVGPLDA